MPFRRSGIRSHDRCTILIVATHLPFGNWAGAMGSGRLAGALLDRLTHRVHILEANGKSYRLREARPRLKRTATPQRPDG